MVASPTPASFAAPGGVFEHLLHVDFDLPGATE